MLNSKGKLTSWKNIPELDPRSTLNTHKDLRSRLLVPLFIIKYPHFLKITRADYYKTIAKLNVQTIVLPRHSNNCIIKCIVIDHNLL